MDQVAGEVSAAISAHLEPLSAIIGLAEVLWRLGVLTMCRWIIDPMGMLTNGHAQWLLLTHGQFNGL